MWAQGVSTSWQLLTQEELLELEFSDRSFTAEVRIRCSRADTS